MNGLFCFPSGRPASGFMSQGSIKPRAQPPAPAAFPDQTTPSPAGFPRTLRGLLRTMPGRRVRWHLLALFFLPLCLCQDEYMEVSGRADNVVARIVQSHQQSVRGGSRRETVRERSRPRAGPVANNASADLKPDERPHPEVDGLAPITPFWGQVLSMLF